jgi:hypothetical protein
MSLEVISSPDLFRQASPVSPIDMDPSSPNRQVSTPQSLVDRRQRVANQRAKLETKFHETCAIIRRHDHESEHLHDPKRSGDDHSPHHDLNAFVQRTTTTASSTSSSAKSYSTSDDDDSSASSGRSNNSSSNSGSSIHDSVETCRTLQVARQKFISPTTGCIYLYSGPVRVVTDPTKPGRSKLVPHGAVGEIWYKHSHHYKGGVQFGFRHGTGEFHWPPRTKSPGVTTTQIYRGAWEHDHREGLGTLIIRRTEGAVSEIARKVVGTWKQGRMHGRVSWTKSDGSRFEGSVVQGRKQGRGTETFRDGKEYSGEFHNGRPNGYGTLKDEDRLYRGQFKEGKRHHHGVQMWQHKLYEGDWDRNEMHGRGKLIWKCTGACYLGEFSNGLFHGQGSYTDGKGSKFIGQWAFGYKEGVGKEYDEQGSIFIGSFHEGQRHGYGRVMYADAGSYSGGWKIGKRWGPGILIRHDGSVEHCGLFDDDEAVLRSRHLETRDDLDLIEKEGEDNAESSKRATRDMAVMTGQTEEFFQDSDLMSTDAASRYFI